MPSYYTNDIFEGKITTFKQFAEKCINKDLSSIEFDMEYFYTELKENVGKLHSIVYKPDKDIIKDQIKLQDKEIVRISNYIKEYKEQNEKIKKLLNDAKKYISPTKEHVSLKNFMISQLKAEILDDDYFEYYNKLLDKAKLAKQSMLSEQSPKRIKLNILKSILENIEYSIEHYIKALDKKTSSMKYIEEFEKSLEKYK